MSEMNINPGVEIMGDAVPTSENATPQEQFDKDKIVTMAMDMLYTEDGRFDAATRYVKEGSNNPVDALSDLTYMIMGQLDDTIEEGLPEESVLPAASEVITEVAEIADKSGAFPVDEALLNAAMQKLIAKIAQEFGIDPTEGMAELTAGLDEATIQQIATQQEGYAVSRQAANPMGPEQVAEGEV